MTNQKYPIGFKFISRNKRKDLCTITDFLTTTNIKGEIVKIRYVATHEFMGQTVTDCDVIEGSITMSIGMLGNPNEEELGNNGEPIKNINPELCEDQVELERLSYETE